MGLLGDLSYANLPFIWGPKGPTINDFNTSIIFITPKFDTDHFILSFSLEVFDDVVKPVCKVLYPRKSI